MYMKYVFEFTGIPTLKLFRWNHFYFNKKELKQKSFQRIALLVISTHIL